MPRHILASLHFNENVHRDTQLSKEGEKYFKVTYPKFKLGYVKDIKKLLFTLSKAEMLEVFNRYSSKAPAPLSAQFEDRVDKQSAVKAYEENRKKRSTVLLFPTSAEQDTLQQRSSVAAEAVTGPRTATVRKCSKCKRPGHNRRNCTVSL